MLRVSIICQGRLKEKYYLGACEEYMKRLSGYCQPEIIELPEEGDPIPKIPKGAYVVAMCIEGQKTDSPGLARRMEQIALEGKSRVCFLIGGSEGLSPEAKGLADWKLSMSDMTFPHHLARVMVLEQIYRALSINAGTKYHK